MDEFLRSYGVWILLAGVFFAMHWFGMGCGGGHRHGGGREKEPEKPDDAKKRPGQITHTSSGLYGASHVPMEMFLQAAGLNMRHLPTTGGAPAMTAVLGGHAAMWASPPAIAVPHLKAGKIRAVFGKIRHAIAWHIPLYDDRLRGALGLQGRERRLYISCVKMP